MQMPAREFRLLTTPLYALLFAICIFAAGTSTAQQATQRYEPTEGQPGKDVVWVPTPDALVERMLDMARVTPEDFVIDLGSGDGRNVIAAAKRGVNALGVEYNERLVELARERAVQVGVADKARFVQGDMYEADISQASVLALFLLTENLDRLAPKFLDLKPGSRIVLNYFTVSGWTPDHSEHISECSTWCTAHLYIVPARVEGDWQIDGGTLTLRQQFQTVRGTLTRGGVTLTIDDGQLRGDRISFTVGKTQYEGRVEGVRMSGERRGPDDGQWTATWTPPAK
jgi:SAM-dependent methyltransferase